MELTRKGNKYFPLATNGRWCVDCGYSFEINDKKMDIRAKRFIDMNISNYVDLLQLNGDELLEILNKEDSISWGGWLPGYTVKNSIKTIMIGTLYYQENPKKIIDLKNEPQKRV